MLGLFVFFYGTVHLLVYIALYSGFSLSAMVTDIAKRHFIIAGIATWLSLVPLALTSTHAAIRKLGGKNWNRLHMLIYLAAILAAVHYWRKMRPGIISPAPYTLALLILLLVRLGIAWRRRWKARAAAFRAVSKV